MSLCYLSMVVLLWVTVRAVEEHAEPQVDAALLLEAG
jgi:hypothetical protein